MKRIAFDTNALLDAFLERSEDKNAQQILQKASEGKIALFIPLLVFFELEWVLRSFYKKEKRFCLELLSSLLLIKTLEVPEKNLLINALDVYAKQAVSFVDAYILTELKNQAIDEFLTKDKKLEHLFKKKQTAPDA